MAFRVGDRGEGRSDRDVLDCWGVLLDTFKDTGCADYGRIKEVFLWVCNVDYYGQLCSAWLSSYLQWNGEAIRLLV